MREELGGEDRGDDRIEDVDVSKLRALVITVAIVALRGGSDPRRKTLRGTASDSDPRRRTRPRAP